MRKYVNGQVFLGVKHDIPVLGDAARGFFSAKVFNKGGKKSSRDRIYPSLIRPFAVHLRRPNRTLIDVHSDLPNPALP